MLFSQIKNKQTKKFKLFETDYTLSVLTAVPMFPCIHSVSSCSKQVLQKNLPESEGTPQHSNILQSSFQAGVIFTAKSQYLLIEPFARVKRAPLPTSPSPPTPICSNTFDTSVISFRKVKHLNIHWTGLSITLLRCNPVSDVTWCIWCFKNRNVTV